MALTDTPNKPEKKPHETHKPPDKREKPLTKVVIRRLPPNIDQETFLNQISPVPDYDYIYTVKGDASLGENSFSRVYINFTKSEDIFDFKEKFDNYVFIDSRGHEYPAVVEFAAFQKIPKKRNKNRVDPKCKTIESDPVYLEFLESINKPQETEIKAEYSYQISNENKKESKQDGTTPLLEYIKNKRAERLRIREERREERKRKELERKKIREDERRKRFEDKSPIKSVVIKAQSSKMSKEPKADGDVEKSEKDAGTHETPQKATYEKSFYKNKEKRYEDRGNVKSKYGTKKEYSDRREYKGRRDDYKDRGYKDRDYKDKDYKDRDYKDRDYKERDYRSKYDDRREGDTKSVQKRVKKYSEKREERIVEAQKAEQKKTEQTADSSSQKVQSSVAAPQKSEESAESKQSKEKSSEPKETKEPKDSKEGTDIKEPKVVKETKVEAEPKISVASVESTEQSLSENNDKESKIRDRDCDSSQKRIRNKDRPTIAIYRPGMLSKRRQEGGDAENKETKKE